MFLKTLKLINFRNYNLLEINLSKNINIFFGENGQGKTNILESIYVLGISKSHRFFNDNILINYNKNNARIIGLVNENNKIKKMEVAINKTNKKLKIDNKDIKKVSDYISNFNIIIFYPEDLELIKGSPNNRRKYINLELSQLYNSYYKVLIDYNKLLKSRNDILKKAANINDIDRNYFSILNEYFIAKAIFIYKSRYKFIKKINENCYKIYNKISNNEIFNVEYQNQFNLNFEEDQELIKNKIRERLIKNLEKEIKLGMTLIGPHRDDFIFNMNDKNLKEFGSQGQQRIAILSFKLAEIEIFKNYKKTSPILLLDDVFSELDDKRKNKLLKYINKNIQTIITTTDIKSIEKIFLNKAKIFEIRNSKIREDEQYE